MRFDDEARWEVSRKVCHLMEIAALVTGLAAIAVLAGEIVVLWAVDDPFSQDGLLALVARWVMQMRT
jgi:hypothetical protein